MGKVNAMLTTTKSQLQIRAEEFADLLASGCFTDRQGNYIHLDEGIEQLVDLFSRAGHDNTHVFIIGNGGSAAVASHIENDLCNVGGLCAATLHEPAILTCYANDYGYEQAFAKRLDRALRPNDILIAISSSGGSANILNAVEVARQRQAKVITLSGWQADNPLRDSGDLNFWLEKQEYGFVEIGHLFLLHHVCDQLARHE
ncbi:MAG: SIS domain-containing protein [Chromatiales bacterium]|jgi:D-sedoheptulose 7-phosphate isomerase